MQLNAQNVQAAQYQPTERQSSNQTQSSTILDIGGGAYEEIEKEETVVSQEVCNTVQDHTPLKDGF